MRPDVKVRWAKDADGDALAGLARACNFCGGIVLDWSRVEPYWMVAEVDDMVVAAMQVLPSRPVGHMDHLLYEPTLPIAIRIRSIGALIDKATAMLNAGGSQMVASIIPDRLDRYMEAAGERGWVRVEDAGFVLKRLT